ncbi:ROK family protein [Pediococcus acidilactici]|nr:ROK family protein [Pediococcus acidilactici]UPM41610.1 ROK family protein [Pediococcus acidilactici]
MDEQLNFTDIGKVNTEQNRNGHILKTLLQISQTIQERIELAGIGVSTAGIVGRDGSIQYAGPTIPDYIGTPIKTSLTAQANLPVSVVNDVDAALLGEVFTGQLVNQDVYCMALGTGIGGAHYRNGKIISGAHGQGNSVGYTLFDPQTNTNYEQRASTLVLERQLADKGVTVIDAFEKAKQGQATYESIIERWANEVARGIAEVVILFDPDYIIIGGAVSAQGQYLIDLFNKQLPALLPPDFNRTTLKIAQQGNQAQLIGAIVPFLKKNKEKVNEKSID